MTAILDGFPGVEIGVYNFMQKDSWLEWVYEDDRQPPLSGRADDRPVRSARGHRLLGRDDVGRGLLGDPPVEQRVLQGLAARERPREHAQVGERDASGRLEYGRAPLEGVRELGLRRIALPLVTVRLDQRRPPRARRGTTRDRPATSRHSSPRCASSGWAAASRTTTTAAGSLPRSTPRTPMRSGPRPRPGTSTRPRRRSTPQPLPGSIHGTAHDNLAVWVVRWRDNLGRSRCRRAGLHASPRATCSTSRTGRWTGAFPGSALTDGASSVTVVAVDIKRNTSAPVVVALGGAGTPPTAEPTGRRRFRASMRLTGAPPRRLVVPRGSPGSGSRSRAEVRCRRVPAAGSTGAPWRRMRAELDRVSAQGDATLEHGIGSRWSPSTPAANPQRRVATGAFASGAADGASVAVSARRPAALLRACHVASRLRHCA